MCNSFHSTLAVRAEGLSLLRASARYWTMHPETIVADAAAYQEWSFEQQRRSSKLDLSLPAEAIDAYSCGDTAKAVTTGGYVTQYSKDVAARGPGLRERIAETLRCAKALHARAHVIKMESQVLRQEMHRLRSHSV